MSRTSVVILCLIIGIILYYIAIYFLFMLCMKAFHIKRKKLCLSVYIVICSLPAFCIIDYINRGIPFVIFMSTIGYLIAGFLIYFSISLFGILLFKKLVKSISKNKVFPSIFTRYLIIICSFFSICICLLGLLFAKFSVISSVSVDFEGHDKIKLIALSDIHYGSTGSMISLDKMVDDINKRKPDVVLFVGDVFDNYIRFLNKEQFSKALNRIEAKSGVYAVTGNHEFNTNSLEEIQSFYEDTSIHLLLDEEVIIENKIRLAGRIDYNYQREERASLESFLSSSTLPLVVLDHQPQLFREAINVGAKLQISGHTHNGQIFPGNLLMGLYNKLLYDSPSIGVHSYGDFTLAITRGYGTWGFPMRLSGSSEIMEFTINC